jgi:hypothetical protein
MKRKRHDRFGARNRDAWVPLERATELRVPEEVAAATGGPGPGVWWVNHLYQVEVSPVGKSGAQMLSIKPQGGAARHDWREFQWNQLCGPEREAIELYPAESRLVDVSNQFWLLVLPPGKRFPFGFEERQVSEAKLWPTSTQRPFPREMRPPDLMTLEEARASSARDLAAMAARRAAEVAAVTVDAGAGVDPAAAAEVEP